MLRGEDTTFEQNPAKDVLEAITAFGGRLYSGRSHNNQR